MDWLIAALPAFFGAVLSALGMGGGGVLLLYLTAFRDTPQLAAQGINLAFFLPVAAVSLAFHIKNKLVDFKIAAVLIPAGILGVFGGSWLAGRLDEALLRKLFAGLLVLIGLRELWSAWQEWRQDREKKNKITGPDNGKKPA